MRHLLDNITWHTLSGPQAIFAAGTDEARRYAPGFSPIVGFANVERPNFDALAPFCKPDEHFYCDGWTGAAPAGWSVDAERTMFKMVWESSIPAADEAPEALRLGPQHAAQARTAEELATDHRGVANSWLTPSRGAANRSCSCSACVKKANDHQLVHGQAHLRDCRC